MLRTVTLGSRSSLLLPLIALFMFMRYLVATASTTSSTVSVPIMDVRDKEQVHSILHGPSREIPLMLLMYDDTDGKTQYKAAIRW